MLRLGKNMNKYKSARKSIYTWSVIMILVGIILIVSGKTYTENAIVTGILEFIGITIIGVFVVSLVYQTFVAEKHFEAFNELLKSELKKMDSIQSKCMKLGIKEIFGTRNEYKRQYPFMKIIDESPDNSEVICIARSLFSLLNMTDEFKKGLKKGLTFKLGCCDPKKITPFFQDMSGLYPTDIGSALASLRDLIGWAVKHQAKGSIELRYNCFNSPNSVLIFTSKDGEENFVWELTFGRDEAQRKLMIIRIDNFSLGYDLKNRYMAIWNYSTPQIRYSNGSIKLSNFDWKFDKTPDGIDQKESKKNHHSGL